MRIFIFVKMTQILKKIVSLSFSKPFSSGFFSEPSKFNEAPEGLRMFVFILGGATKKNFFFAPFDLKTTFYLIRTKISKISLLVIFLFFFYFFFLFLQTKNYKNPL